MIVRTASSCSLPSVLRSCVQQLADMIYASNNCKLSSMAPAASGVMALVCADVSCWSGTHICSVTTVLFVALCLLSYLHACVQRDLKAARGTCGPQMGGWLASWLWTPSAPQDSHPRPGPTSFARSQSDQQLAASESQASATGNAAWDVMAAHGWALLQTGSLQELTVLGLCLAAVGGRLDSLLVAAAAQGGQKQKQSQKQLHLEPTPDEVISGELTLLLRYKANPT